METRAMTDVEAKDYIKRHYGGDYKRYRQAQLAEPEAQAPVAVKKSARQLQVEIWEYHAKRENLTLSQYVEKHKCYRDYLSLPE